ELFFWGYGRLELDENLLALGKVALIAAEGILPDGTLFRFSSDDGDPLILERDIQENDIIYLAVPALVQGSTESHEDEVGDHSARFRVVAREVANSHGSVAKQATVATGKLRARLVTESQRVERDVALPLCRIK